MNTPEVHFQTGTCTCALCYAEVWRVTLPHNHGMEQDLLWQAIRDGVAADPYCCVMPGEDLVKKMHNEYNQRLGRLRLGWWSTSS
eukprot:3818123-Amphidinium_carterae.1